METLSNLLSNNATYALLDDSKSSPSKSKNLLFSNPQEEIIARNQDELPQALDKIEQLKKEGYYLCGYLSYEAGYFFIDKEISNRQPKQADQPLLYFIAFKDLQRPSRKEIDDCFNKATIYPESKLCLHNLQRNVSEPDYLDNISKIKAYIEAGDTYQINYTLKYHFKLQGTATTLYKILRKKQPVEFGALLNFPESKIVSLSPELFIKKKKNILTSKPMKGTAKRGSNKKEDKNIIRFLKQDSKTLSENVMIVDLIRNDFGRVCQTGSVRVKNLFQVQTFKTLHQMISTVKGKLRKNLSFRDLLHALFPCGSITGAPKIRTMEIINELENDPRGIYTGAIGYLLPNNDFYFNVPIRTIAIDKENHCEMGIGSGIIHESDAKDEFAECLLKADFLTSVNQDFYLIESFRLDAKKQVFINLEQHLTRLTQSANCFGFQLNNTEINEQLEKLKKTQHSGLHKIRLALYQNGKVEISHSPINTKSDSSNVVLISETIIDSTSVFQYHKTSRREHYNQAYDKAEKQGAYDVLFFNEKEQLVEASRHNIFIKKEACFYTPLLSTGALNGIQRQAFMQQNKVKEAHLTRDDLLNADEILLTNSVRGVVRVEL